MRAGGGGARELADETKFMQPGLEQPELMVTALAAHNTLTDCLMQEDGEPDVLEKMVQDVSSYSIVMNMFPVSGSRAYLSWIRSILLYALRGICTIRLS